ncbi:MAG: phage virion morphogenesis protein [Meiothermus sp.]|nr:phage virion morphogenesis protein [Meiothermus sp.]
MGVRITGDLNRLKGAARRLSTPRLNRVAAQAGEALVSSTVQRFDAQQAPDGTPWQPLAASTVAPRARDFTKSGRIRKPAERRMLGRKILIQSARLRNSISHRRDGTRVAVGTNVRYARIHQLGGMAGRGRKVQIPARPYLGVSEADRAEIRRILARELSP